MTNSASPSDKLSLSTKLAYGAGDMSAGMTANLESWSLLFFLTNVAGLNPALAGVVLLIGKIWDGINDPLVGVMSDRTRSPRWGRRHSWMLYAAIPFGVSFCLRWLVPDWNATTLFWYYVLTSIIFNTAFTAVNLPYTALTAELTQDYNERTSLSSFRLAFSLGGAVLILAFSLLMGQVFPDRQQQYLMTAIGCAILSVVTIFWCIAGTRRRVRQLMAHFDQQADVEASLSTPILEQVKIALSNRPFLFVIGIYLFSWLAIQMMAALVPFYVENYMGLGSFLPVALTVQGVAIVMLFVCNVISRRFGKRALYFMGTGLWLIVQIGLLSLQPGQVWQMYLLCFAASFGIATAYLVPWSILPDVIDLDELKTGQRREGVFYSFMTLLQKVGLAIGLFLVSQLLAIAGFVQTPPGQPFVDQPPSAVTAIRLATGLLPMISLIGGLVLMYFYPLTRELHSEVSLKLRSRQAVK